MKMPTKNENAGWFGYYGFASWWNPLLQSGVPYFDNSVAILDMLKKRILTSYTPPQKENWTQPDNYYLDFLVCLIFSLFI